MRVKVYQVDVARDENQTLFHCYDHIIATAKSIDPSIYKTVYDGQMDTQDPEEIFSELNTHPPVGYNGHTMTVSDVLELENGECYFCDFVGFKHLADFDASQVSPIVGHRMLVLEPRKTPYEMVIPDRLEALQQAVGGWIECTYPFKDNTYVIGNEEAKLIGLEGNRRINGQIYAGTILIAGDDGMGGTMDLTDEQIRKYTQLFQIPEDITPEEIQNDMRFVFVSFGESE